MNIFSGIIPKNSFTKLLLFFVMIFGAQGINAQTNYYYKGTGNINATASWGINTNGSGTAPSNFTSNNAIFNIRNAATPNLNGAWTVSGTNSKIVVGDGTNTCSFTVGSNFVLTAPVDVSANATITLSTTGSITGINFGTLNATSTVDFSSTVAQTIPVETYGNVTVSGAKGNNDVVFAGETNIAGNLTINATGNSGAQLIFNSTNQNRTFNIDGDYTQTSYEAELGSGSGTSTINLAGDFQKTGGYMVTTGSYTLGSFNFTGTAQKIQCNGGTDAKWTNFNVKPGSICTLIGTFNLNGTAVYKGTFTVNSGGTVICGVNNIVGPANVSAFIIDSGGTLQMGLTAGITTSGATGNIQTGTRTYSTGANYIYNGTSAQVTGNGLTQNTPKNLTIDNNAGVTLSVNTTLSGDLLISQGTFKINNFNMSVGGNWTNNDGFAAGTGTVTFTGTTGTIGGKNSTSFPNLAIDGTSATAYTMNNDNSCTNLSFNTGGSSSSLSHAGLSSLMVNGTVTINQPTNTNINAWNINAGTATVSGLITFAGTNTSTSRIGKIVTTTGTLNANGGITFVGSAAATKVIDMSGGAGNLNLKGKLTVPGASSTLVPGILSTFSYVDKAAQTINKFTTGNYYNLAVSGSGIKTFAAATDITNNLSIALIATVTFSNNSDSTANSLTLGVTNQNQGIWGGTGSGASYIDTNYFNPTTNGRIVISAGSCPAGYWLGGTSTAWDTTTNWCNGVVPTATTNVIIPSGVKYMPTIAAGTSALANNLTINALATLTLSSAANSLLNIKGDFTNNGTLTAGAASTVTFDGTSAAAIAGSSTSSFGSVTINKSTAAVTNSIKAFAVSGNLTVTQGNLVLTATNDDYKIGNDLIVSSAGTLSHNVNWSNDKKIDVAGNIAIDGAYSYVGSALINMNTGGKTIRTGTAALSFLTFSRTTGDITANGNVTVNHNFWSNWNIDGTGKFVTGNNIITANATLNIAGGSVLINGGTLNVTGGLNIGFTTNPGAVTLSSGTLNADILNVGDGTNLGTFTHTGGTANIGNLIISGGAKANAYTCTNSPVINISGNYTNNKTFTAASSTVNFTGTSAQTINGTLSGTPGKFYNLTFNGIGGTWTNTAPIEVANTLTMTNGVLNTTTSNIVNITNTATAGAAGGKSTSFVSGPIKWTLPTSLISGSAYNFPIGKGTYYLPFSLVNPTTGTGVITAQAEAFNTDSGGTADLTSIGTLSTTEYWSLVVSGNFTNSSISLSRPTAIAPLDIIGGSTVVNGSGVNAYKSLLGTLSGTTGLVNSSTIGTNRFFAFGRHEIRIGTLTGSSFCAGSPISVPFTIAGVYNAGNSFTAQLSDPSGSFASPTVIGALAGTASGTISAVIPAGTAAGTGYRIRVVSTNPIVVGYDNGINLTISPVSVGGTVSSVQTICYGTSPLDLSLSGQTGAVVKWQKATNADFTGATNIVNTTTTLPSSTIGNLTTDTYFRAVVQSGVCSVANSLPVLIAVASNNTITLTSAAGSDTPTICFSTAINPITYKATGATGATVTGLPTGVSGNWVSGIFTISGTPSVSGSYPYTVTLTGGCGTVTATGTIVVGTGIPTTFKDGTWTAGVPDIKNTAIFESNYTTNNLAGSFTACSCTVNSGATLTVSKDTFVTIQNDITNNGKIIVESEGNLIQVNDSGTYIPVAGATFTVIRNSPMKRLDYTYWSAPVIGQKLQTFSPSTVNTRFLEYHENDDYFYPVNWSTNFEITKGYAIRAPNNFPATYTVGNPLNLFKGTFVGTPNNGSIPFTLSRIGNGYNLVGNPYPSNIDFEELLTAKGSDGISNKDKIFGTAYFWTNNDPNPPKEQQGSAYNGNNYAIYNGTGGVPSLETKAAPSGGAVPTQFIKVGQGFIVKSKLATNNQALVFNNSIRSESNDSKFFSKGNTSAKDRYWLKLTSPALNVNTILIGYIPNATNDFEFDYDAPLMAVGSDSFYSMLNQDKLGIQGRQYPLNTSDVVVLGTNQYEPGNYSISLGNKEGVFADGQNIYLKDKQTGTVTNLSEGSYTFAANKGLTEGRFEILYQPEIVLASGGNPKDELVIYRDGNDFVIKSSIKNITGLEVYDASGKLIITLKQNQKENRIDATTFSNGIYILKINRSGHITSKKIIK